MEYLSKLKTNQIVDLGCGLISKEFVSKENLDAEVVGSMVFNYLSPGSSAEVVLVGGENCLIKRVAKADSLTAVEKSYLEAKVAGVVAEVYASYPLIKDFLKIKPWSRTLEELLCGVKKNKNILAGVIGGKNVGALYAKVSAVKSEEGDTYSCPNLTFIHGDLHMGNLAFNDRDNSVKMLDFEHSKEAPIEMEFQNSLFFADEMSLDVPNIKAILRGRYKVPYSDKREMTLSVVYFCEQLVKAAVVGDEEKLILLRETAKVRGML